jgi:DNA-binding GntR family transcriptional regulator
MASRGVKSAGNATNTIYAALRREIMAGRHAPGDQLKEERIAEAMAVSRTPVRAALQRLVGDGLLRSEANRGVFVAAWTRWDIEDVFDLRLVLEPHAAGLAALRASREQSNTLTALTDKMDAATLRDFRENLQDIQEANQAFHETIIEAAGSPRLLGFLNSLVAMPMIAGSFYVYTEEEMRSSIRHHREIITAIEAKDRMFAGQAMAVHLQISHMIFQRNQRVDPTVP